LNSITVTIRTSSLYGSNLYYYCNIQVQALLTINLKTLLFFFIKELSARTGPYDCLSLLFIRAMVKLLFWITG